MARLLLDCESSLVKNEQPSATSTECCSLSQAPTTFSTHAARATNTGAENLNLPSARLAPDAERDGEQLWLVCTAALPLPWLVLRQRQKQEGSVAPHLKPSTSSCRLTKVTLTAGEGPCLTGLLGLGLHAALLMNSSWPLRGPLCHPTAGLGMGVTEALSMRTLAICTTLPDPLHENLRALVSESVETHLDSADDLLHVTRAEL